jgi:ribosomal peptide maturation radical SAM protein 1
LLISMPFAPGCRPSAALGALATYLRQEAIPVEIKHAYLTCVDRIGPELYQRISTAEDELFYPFFLHPEHAETHRREIEARLRPLACRGGKAAARDLLTQTLERLAAFHEDFLRTVDPARYALVGFTVTFDQLRASLYLARRLKERRPDLPIVFGGALCVGAMGKSLMATFPEVDYAIAGEGEAALAALCRCVAIGGEPRTVPSLIWREGTEVRVNGLAQPMDMESLPVPDYGEFFERLETCSPETRQTVRTYLSIPFESGRGCWWGKCTFCALNAVYHGYRPKPAAQAANEVRALVERHRCQAICMVDNVERHTEFGELMQALSGLNLDLDLFMEIRAGHLTREDYALMRDAGVKTIQIGIEAFGDGMLRKIRKGVTPIHNVAAIKHCQEFGIFPYYNVIVGYPNEESSDLDETAQNIRHLSGLVPPFSVLPMWLGCDSPVYNELSRFNIAEVCPPPHAGLLFPDDVWQTLVPWRFGFRCVTPRPDRYEAWRAMFAPWQKETERRVTQPLFFYQDGGTFASLTDLRSGCAERTELTKEERDVYAFCADVRTLAEIQSQFPALKEEERESMLDRFTAKGWMYREQNRYLSLAIRLHPGLSPLAYRCTVDVGREPLLGDFLVAKRDREWNVRLGGMGEVRVGVSLRKQPDWLRKVRAALR